MSAILENQNVSQHNECRERVGNLDFEAMSMACRIRKLDIQVRMDDIQRFKVWFKENETRIQNMEFLRNTTGIIHTPRRRNTMDMTPGERMAAYDRYLTHRFKRAVDIANGKTEDPNLSESVEDYRKRMGYSKPKGKGIRWTRQTADNKIPCPNCLGHNKDAHGETYVREDILGPSKPALRSLRATEPEAYITYTEALKDEMGPHFREELVL